MFTISEILGCVCWFVAHVLFPCALLYGVWFVFRQPAGRKFNLVADMIRCVIFGIATMFVFFYMAIPTLEFWPPHWLERARQRQTVYERAQEAGGWNAIKNDANDLVQKYDGMGYNWFSSDRNDESDLPGSFAALKPKSIDIGNEPDGMCSVRIRIFGSHSSGGRGKDFYTVIVVFPFPTNIARPFRVNEGAKARYGDRKIADGVFEETHGA
jgi:hypothetical protein